MQLDSDYEILKFFSQPDSRLSDVPPASLSYRVCFAAFTRNKGKLRDVPAELRTREICLLALEEGAADGESIPAGVLDEEFCRESIRRNRGSVQSLPIQILRKFMTDVEIVETSVVGLSAIPACERTNNLCRAAIEKYPWALYLVPDELKTPEICHSAVSRCGSQLEYVPEELMTEQLVAAASAEDALSVRYAPAHLQSVVACKRAVLAANIKEDFDISPPEVSPPALIKNWEVLKQLIEEGLTQAIAFADPILLDQEIYSIAYMHRFRLSDIPERFRDIKMYETGMAMGRIEFADIPREFACTTIIDEAIRLNGGNLAHVRSCKKNLQTCIRAVKTSPMAIKHVPKQICTEELCFSAVSGNGSAIQFVPLRFRSYALSWLAVLRDWESIRFVGPDYFDVEICRNALFSSVKSFRLIVGLAEEYGVDVTATYPEVLVVDGLQLRYVPIAHRSKSLCEMAVFTSDLAYEHVPDEHKSVEMCRTIISRNPKASDFLKIYSPKDIRDTGMLDTAHEGGASAAKPAEVLKKYCNPRPNSTNFADERGLVGAVFEAPEVLQLFPRKLISDSIYLFALEAHGARSDEFVPSEILERYNRYRRH